MKKEKKKNNKFSLTYVLDFLTELIAVTIKKINKFLTLKKTSPIVKAVIRGIVCLFLLLILEIPFFIVEKIGVGIIHLLTDTFSEIIIAVWVPVTNYLYLIFALVILFRVINDMAKRKEYNIEIKSEDNKKDNLYIIVSNILKVIIFIVLIPIMLFALLLFAILGMLLYLITHGIFVVSPFLIVIGVIVIICTSLSYIYDVIVLDEGGSK